MSRAVKYFQVFFIEEPVFRQAEGAHLEIKVTDEGVTVVVPVLDEACDRSEAVSHVRDLLETLLEDRDSLGRVLWYYTAQAVCISRDLAADVVVYDNMDELSAFLGASPELITLEEELFARADLVFTGGMSLYEAKRHRHANIHPFPSSIDAPHFSTARLGLTAPDDQRLIPHPRIGFFGVIDERMDVDLVSQVADLRPDWHFVMIGPVVKIEPADLPRRPNIHWLGMKRYAELPEYLSGWDCGFMPFAQNAATRFISPTKTPEFLAAGLRVVSTPIPDVVAPYGERGLVQIARNAAEVVASIHSLLPSQRSGAGSTKWARAVDQHLALSSWDKTWAAMNAQINAITDETETAAIPVPALGFALQ
ncbi:glycosyltransferase [Aquabacter sp. CN5-332]|uniref:glycosyltransferase n=1 Tax=Aquabacter sp. CN5-332 TaxID=3156608 RepID=UPI0032B422CC